jgi:hypothetical protein
MGHKNIMHTVRYTEMATGSVQELLEGLKYPEVIGYFLW